MGAYKKKDKRYGEKYDAVSWLKNHPEDIPLARENLAARDKGYDNDGLRQLLAAVCLRACADYKLATCGVHVRQRDPEVVIEDCHKFFDSDIFNIFINRISREEVERTIRSSPKGAISNSMKNLIR